MCYIGCIWELQRDYISRSRFWVLYFNNYDTLRWQMLITIFLLFHRTDTTTTSSTLPASSAYYQTSASKAKILHLVQEKVEGGEISEDEEIENEDEINRKKVGCTLLRPFVLFLFNCHTDSLLLLFQVELIASISAKMTELQTVKNLIKAEMKANEELGKQVQACAKNVRSLR